MPTKPDTETQKYYVTNLYDVDYLLDQNRIVILQANRPPSVADMEAVAARFNEFIRLREAARDAMKWMSWWVESEGADLPDELPPTPEILAALREALANTGEQK